VPPDRRSERQAALRLALEAEGLDGLVVTHLPNIRYLTGFTGSAAVVLIGVHRSTLISDFRYAAQAPAEVGSAASVEIDQRSVWDRLAKLLSDGQLEALGIEAHTLSVKDAERISALTTGRVIATTDLVERQRAMKSSEEIEAIRAAAQLAQEALAQVLPRVRSGQTELEIGAELEGALRRKGSEWHPFPTIVASGPRSALPHARTSRRVLGAGDLLLIDFGAQVDGYCSDLTRTVVVGAKADERQRTVHELVQTAQRRAIEHLRPGMSGREGDALARDVIAQGGYGDAFGHSLGHGLGLEVHEAPRLAANADVLLPAHAVVTVEPGVYFPGWGGIRLEDDIYLAPGGAERLSDGRTELLELV
jgi:Xaa-Pro aminopeptidase